MPEFIRGPKLTPEQKQLRKEQREADATQAMTDRAAAEDRARRTFERLRAERLARERQ